MEKQKTKPNTIRRIGYFIIAAILLLSAMYVIPIETYEVHAILYSAIFGVISAYFLFQTIYDYKREDWSSDDEESSNYDVLWLSLFVVVIPVFLIIYQSNRIDDVLLNNGITAKGIIVDLISYKVKRSEMFEAKILYVDENGVEHTSVTSIDENEFYKARRGTAVDIFYSPSNPEVVSLLNTKYNREKFNISNSDLGIEEEEKMPETKEELQALIKKLEVEMIKEKDKSLQMEILAEYMKAKHHLKKLEK